MKRPVKIVLWIVLTPLLFVVWIWTLGAGYYMVGNGSSILGMVVTWGYLVFTLLFLIRLRRYTLWWLLATWLIGLVWLLSLQPSNDRDWRVEVARTPNVTVEGDQATIRNIRNFKYRTADDFDVDYYDKTFDLGELDTVDLVMCYWDGNTEIAHTMLSFGFDGKDFICLSVEIRRENGEDWGAVPGIYKQFEVIYVLGDERDLINLRTSYREEDVYLYRMTIPRNEIRQYFEVVLGRVDKRSREPEFYDTLQYNCSSSLTRMAAQLWPERPRARGIRSLFNGHADENAYSYGRISNDLPFEELKRRSYITSVSQQHRDAPDFSQKVREALPRINRGSDGGK